MCGLNRAKEQWAQQEMCQGTLIAVNIRGSKEAAIVLLRGASRGWGCLGMMKTCTSYKPLGHSLQLTDCGPPSRPTTSKSPRGGSPEKLLLCSRIFCDLKTIKPAKNLKEKYKEHLHTLMEIHQLLTIWHLYLSFSFSPLQPLLHSQQSVSPENKVSASL